jgi:hypothetical protein
VRSEAIDVVFGGTVLFLDHEGLTTVGALWILYVVKEAEMAALLHLDLLNLSVGVLEQLTTQLASSLLELVGLDLGVILLSQLLNLRFEECPLDRLQIEEEFK